MRAWVCGERPYLDLESLPGMLYSMEPGQFRSILSSYQLAP